MSNSITTSTSTDNSKLTDPTIQPSTPVKVTKSAIVMQIKGETMRDNELKLTERPPNIHLAKEMLRHTVINCEVVVPNRTSQYAVFDVKFIFKNVPVRNILLKCIQNLTKEVTNATAKMRATDLNTKLRNTLKKGTGKSMFTYDFSEFINRKRSGVTVKSSIQSRINKGDSQADIMSDVFSSLGLTEGQVKAVLAIAAAKK